MLIKKIRCPKVQTSMGLPFFFRTMESKMESRTPTMPEMSTAMLSATSTCTMPRMPRTMTWRVLDVGVDLDTVVMHTHSF